MARHKLSSREQLLGFFFERMGKTLANYDKDLAVWEDVANVFEKTTSSPLIYAWLEPETSFTLAQRGFDIIQMHAPWLYFDHRYEDNPKEPGYYWAAPGHADTYDVYFYDPLPPAWEGSVRQRIKGLTGAIYTETIETRQRLDYMVFPRIDALAEVAWSPRREAKDWPGFRHRLVNRQFRRYDYLGIDYRGNLAH